MPKVLSDLRTDVQSHLDEVVSRFWTPGELNGWINEANRDVARRSETLQDKATIAVPSGIQQFPMPVDVCRLHRIEFVPTGGTQIYPLEPRSLDEMDSIWGIWQTTPQSYPLYYAPWGYPPSLKAILYPTPSQAGVLNVYYYRLPKEALSDTDLIEIPEGWWDLLVLYCEYVALRKDRDARWSEAKQIYDERLSTMIDMTRRWVDSAGVITNGHVSLPGWLYSDGYDW